MPHDGAGPPTFTDAFHAHGDAIFTYFARRVPRADVADLTAETFRVAHEAWHRFDPARSSPRPWLYGIATNVLRHHQRRHTREARAVARLATEVGPSVDAIDERLAALDAAVRWPQVAAALDALAPIDRDALLLVAWEGLSYADIAAATDAPVGTVRSRINRARRQLRELLGADGQHPVDQPTTAGQEAHRHG